MSTSAPRVPSPSTGLGTRSSGHRAAMQSPVLSRRCLQAFGLAEVPLNLIANSLAFQCRRPQRHVIATAHRAHMSIVSLVAHRPCEAAQGPVNGVTCSDAPPPAAPPARRRRRPSGEAPPLPRHIGTTGRAWLLTSAVAVAWLLASIHLAWVQLVTDRADAAVLRALAGLRTSWLTPVARGVDRVATGWTMFVVAMLLVLVSIVWKRWRHLFAFLGSVVVLRLIGLALHGRSSSASALRRHDDRNVERVFVAVGHVGDRVHRRHRCHLHGRRRRAGPARSPRSPVGC